MSEADVLTWDDVEHAAEKMFTLWVGESELAWAREAWAHLGAAGLTGAYDLEEHTRSQLRLVTLAHMYDRFCEHAWEESWSFEPSDFAEHLELQPLGVGILYGRLQPDVDEWDASTVFAEAVDALCRALKPEIFNCLVQAYGGTDRLFARLWNTRGDELEEGDTDGTAFELEADNAAGFAFVERGFLE